MGKKYFTKNNLLCYDDANSLISRDVLSPNVIEIDSMLLSQVWPLNLLRRIKIDEGGTDKTGSGATA